MCEKLIFLANTNYYVKQNKSVEHLYHKFLGWAHNLRIIRVYLHIILGHLCTNRVNSTK